MKKIFVLSFLLAGCATAPLTPTSVNPGLTNITNTAMALVAAASGDCSVPIASVTGVGTACANLPATATTADNQMAFQNCVAAAAGSRIGNQIAMVKVGLCGLPQPMVSVPVPAAPAKTTIFVPPSVK